MKDSTWNWFFGIMCVFVGISCLLLKDTMNGFYCVMIANLFASLARLEEKE